MTASSAPHDLMSSEDTRRVRFPFEEEVSVHRQQVRRADPVVESHAQHATKWMVESGMVDALTVRLTNPVQISLFSTAPDDRRIPPRLNREEDHQSW